MAIITPLGVMSDNNDQFYYNEKRDLWSRVLVKASPRSLFGEQLNFRRQVMISIGSGQIDKKEASHLWDFRKICIYDQKGTILEGKYTHYLPIEVYGRLFELFNGNQLSFLLDLDIMKGVDLEKAKKEYRISPAIPYASIKKKFDEENMSETWYPDYVNDPFFVSPNQLTLLSNKFNKN